MTFKLFNIGAFHFLFVLPVCFFAVVEKLCKCFQKKQMIQGKYEKEIPCLHRRVESTIIWNHVLDLTANQI